MRNPPTVPFLIATNPVNYGKPWRLVRNFTSSFSLSLESL